MPASEDRLLHVRAFVMPAHDESSDRLFFVVLALVLGCCLACAIALTHVKVPDIPLEAAARMVRTRFVLEPKKPEAVKPPPPKPIAPKGQDKPKDEAPLDLTKKPEVAQKQDDIQPPSEAPVVRRVYGLRRVYAMGIGAGGSAASAVIGKLGNTLKKDIDTIAAVPTDVKGQVASVTTVTTQPKLRKRAAAPEYTQEMKDNKVEGVVKVKVLIDIDGKVKKAVAQNDLGFGTAAMAEKWCSELEFDPAMRGEEAVAVWFMVSVRFALLG